MRKSPILLLLVTAALALPGCKGKPKTDEAGTPSASAAMVDTAGAARTGNGDTRTGNGDTRTGNGDTRTGNGDTRTGNGDTRSGGGDTR